MLPAGFLNPHMIRPRVSRIFARIGTNKTVLRGAAGVQRMRRTIENLVAGPVNRVDCDRLHGAVVQATALASGALLKLLLDGDVPKPVRTTVPGLRRA